MSIERLGPIDPVSAYNKNSKTNRAPKTGEGDSILVSEEARAKAELMSIAKEVRTSDDVRMDKVEDIKRKLQDPSYLDETVLAKTAENIMEAFGL